MSYLNWEFIILNKYQFGLVKIRSGLENFLNLPNYVRANQWVEQAKILETGRETSYSQKLLDEENEDLNVKACKQDL